MTDTPNTTQGKGAVDWTKPIEARTNDGEWQSAEVEDPADDDDPRIGVRLSDNSYVLCDSHGLGASRYANNYANLIVRNVPEHHTPTQYAPELVERMVALVRTMSLACPFGVKAMGYGQREAYETARSIVSDLPQEVDPDLLAARECVMEVNGCSPYTEAGKDDDGQLVRAALLAIKRGRQLERGELA